MEIRIVNNYRDYYNIYHYYDDYIKSKFNYDMLLKQSGIDLTDTIVDAYWYDCEEDVLYIKIKEEDEDK